MSKELEALEKIDEIVTLLRERANIYIDELDNETNYDEYIEHLFNYFNKQSLTPPTQEEVCEVLSEYLKGNVKVVIDKYDDCSFMSFVAETDKYQNLTIVIKDFETETIEIEFALPPHLITLIGRFYEGVEKE